MAKFMRADQFEKARGGGAYLIGLLDSVERKNRWQLAQMARFDTPYRFQYLLRRGAWDTHAFEQLGEALASLGEEDALLATNENGSVKQGKKG